jgi:hypothetical protein
VTRYICQFSTTCCDPKSQVVSPEWRVGAPELAPVVDREGVGAAASHSTRLLRSSRSGARTKRRCPRSPWPEQPTIKPTSYTTSWDLTLRRSVRVGLDAYPAAMLAESVSVAARVGRAVVRRDAQRPRRHRHQAMLGLPAASLIPVALSLAMQVAASVRGGSVFPGREGVRAEASASSTVRGMYQPWGRRRLLLGAHELRPSHETR